MSSELVFYNVIAGWQALIWNVTVIIIVRKYVVAYLRKQATCLSPHMFAR